MTMLNRGTVAIFAILSLGISMAAFSVWYQARMGRRCLEIWGVEGANLIRHAPRVDGLRIASPQHDPAESPESPDHVPEFFDELLLGNDEPALPVDAHVDISQARGLVHARHALIVDHNYDAVAESLPATRHWQYVLQFTAADRTVYLLLDPDSRCARIWPTGGEQRLRQETMRAVVAFIERELSSVGGDKRSENIPSGTRIP